MPVASRRIYIFFSYLCKKLSVVLENKTDLAAGLTETGSFGLGRAGKRMDIVISRIRTAEKILQNM